MKSRTRITLIFAGIIATVICLRAIAVTQLRPVSTEVLAQWQLASQR